MFSETHLKSDFIVKSCSFLKWYSDPSKRLGHVPQSDRLNFSTAALIVAGSSLALSSIFLSGLRCFSFAMDSFNFVFNSFHLGIRE